jgi:hypothetical protein
MPDFRPNKASNSNVDTYEGNVKPMIPVPPCAPRRDEPVTAVTSHRLRGPSRFQ